jgi:hypothetical protein
MSQDSPQSAGEVRSDQARRDAIDADVVFSPLDRKIARKLNVGGFGDIVGSNHGRALECADRRDDDDGAVVALKHALCGHLDQPMVGEDVVVEDLAKLLVRDAGHRSIVGIGRGVTHTRMSIQPKALIVSSTRR